MSKIALKKKKRKALPSLKLTREIAKPFGTSTTTQSPLQC